MKYFDRLLLGLLCGYLILIPSLDLLPGFDRYNEKRVLELVLLIAFTLPLLIDPRIRTRWLNLFTNLALATRYTILASLALGVISASLAVKPGLGLVEVSLFTLLLLSSFTVADLYRNAPEPFARAVLISLTLSSSLFSTTFFSAYAAALLENLPILNFELYGNFSSVRFFNQFQSWTLPLITLPLLFFKQSNKTPYYYLTFFVASCWWMMLFTSASRGTFLGLVTAFTFILIVYGKQARTWFAPQGITFIAGGILYCVLFVFVPLLSNTHGVGAETTVFERDYTRFYDRWFLLARAWELSINNPLLGVGPMHGACDSSNTFAAHPHNATLQISSEWGAIVLIMICVLFYKGIKSWTGSGLSVSKETQRENQWLHISLTASLIAAATHAQFSGILIMPLSQVMMVLVTGWMIGIYFKDATYKTQKKVIPTIILWCGTALSLAILLYNLYPEILILHESQQNFVSQHPELYKLHPRLWQQGHICG